MQNILSQSESIQVTLLPMQNGQKIGVLCLNTEKRLNALSREMTEVLYSHLEHWKYDDEIACIWLEAAGNKAFCSGGDLQAIYQYMQEVQGQEVSIQEQKLQQASQFFAEEYQFNYYLHCYPKPIIAWGHGIIMGGGMGLFNPASHRIVTEASRLSMPEIAVGLFPDTGGTWFLHQCPGRTGLFLALTGAALQAADALFAGWADHYIPAARKQDVIRALQAISHPLPAAEVGAEITRLLLSFAESPPDVHGLRTHYDAIQKACVLPTLEEVVHAILSLPNEVPFIALAQQNLSYGAPSTARIAYTLYHRAKFLSLYEIFALEHQVAIRCLEHGDFTEGIRALLIDKDRTPRWNPPTLPEASAAWVEKFFVPLGEKFPFVAFPSLHSEQ